MIIKTFLKKLINIVPIEDTYFVLVEKPKNIKLSKDAIYLNYKHLSPFKDGDLIYLQTKNNIFIWFTKYKLIDKNKIYIPEGYLIYKVIKSKKEAIGIAKKSESIYILSVVKNGLLLSQLTIKNDNLNQKITFLIKEYSLKNPEKINIPISKLKLSFIDVFLFSKFSLELNKLYSFIIERLSMPISVFIILLTVFYFFINQYLEKEIKKKTDYLNKLKLQTKDIKNLLYQTEQKKQFWLTFIKNEKKYPSLYYLLDKIFRVIKEKDGYITHLEFNENIITIWAGLKAGDISIVNDLIKEKIFKEVKIISSVKDRQRKGYEIMNIEIYLKEQNE